MAPSTSQLTTASGAIGLAKSVIDFVPATGTLMKASVEMYNWVIREGINEGLFETCRTLALGLAYPNDEGEDIQRKIAESDKNLLQMGVKAPLRLISSGTLGRLLARDPETRYIVSTVAATTKYHTEEFATDLLCSMLLNKEGHQSELSRRYDVKRAPIRAVVSRIIKSVYLNVINAGHDLGELPTELRDVASALLDHQTFACIIMRIQNEDGDIVIRSRRLLGDLTLWLLFHFHGQIEVSVGNIIRFTKTLGITKRLIRLMVRDGRAEDQEEYPSLNSTRQPPVEVQVSVGDRLETVLTGFVDANAVPISRARRSLYDVGDRTSTRRPGFSLNREEYLEIQRMAKGIIEWMLNLTVQPALSVSSPGSECDLVFRVVDRGNLDNKILQLHRLEELFPRRPMLLQIGTGLFPRSTGVAIAEPDDRHTRGSQAYKDIRSPPVELSPYAAIEWFPAVLDVLEQVKRRCSESCAPCQSPSPSLRDCKKGCRRVLAADLLYVLLTHAICDAFGVDDVSGKDSSSDSTVAMGVVLNNLVHHREIHWNSWFELVACAASGLSYNDLPRQPDEGSSAWVALQYGSYVLMVPWLDINSRIEVNGCFTLKVFEGNIEGASGDVAALRCETVLPDWAGQPADADLEHLDAHEQQPESVERERTLAAARDYDTSTAKLSTVIFKSGPNLFRVMLTVQATNRISVVDPSKTIMGLARSPKQPQCSHTTNTVPSWAGPFYCADFPMILEQWFCRGCYHSHSCLTAVIDSYLKLNTIFSIAHYGAVLRPAESCCIQCALERMVGSHELDDYRMPVSLVISTTLARETGLLAERPA